MRPVLFVTLASPSYIRKKTTAKYLTTGRHAGRWVKYIDGRKGLPEEGVFGCGAV